MSNTMSARDTISASLAECFITIEGNRYNFAEMISLKDTFNKTKSKVPILFKTG